MRPIRRRRQSVIPSSIPGLVEVEVIRGTEAQDAAPRLLIDIPHGATTTEDFVSHAAMLESPLPKDLIDFYYVNTDTGAPELAVHIASEVVKLDPTMAVLIMRCRVPRTFIDCNRNLDATPEEFKAGGVAPGLMPWVTSERDRALLVDRHRRYYSAVCAAADAMPADGAMLLMHTYAPRTVGVQVDLNIVDSLHKAYAPDVEPTWPLRPEMDIIGRGPNGEQLAPVAVCDALRDELAAIDMKLGDSTTYPLHPSTLGWHHAVRKPGRSLCLEVRRDLVVDRFIPFAEAKIDPARVARLAPPIARALLRWW